MEITIGDIHGRDTWKQIVSQPFEKVRFIGDYVDSFNVSGLFQLNNLRGIIQFKKDNPTKVTLLIGNHDYQYWPSSPDIGNYSGFQPSMLPSFQNEFSSHKDLFDIADCDEEGVIYTHAGITESFMQRVGCNSRTSQGIVNHFNNLFVSKPRLFAFHPGDRSGGGDDVRQSCIWVRPRSLYNDRIDKLQVVGHTEVGQINHPAKSERRGFYMVDCLPKQYLVKINGKFEIKNVNGT